MPFPIEKKLVIAVASSALFQLDEADAVFRKQGMRAYRDYQREHENDVLAPGIAFPFVRRFLELNRVFPDRKASILQCSAFFILPTLTSIHDYWKNNILD